MVSVLAVVDSDSYLKWACATLDGLTVHDGTAPTRSVVVLRSPLMPTDAQIAAATAGTAIAFPLRLGRRGLRRLVARESPDVVIVGATGPVAELIARTVTSAGPSRPALVAGLPGMALPATEIGVAYRRWCDAFVVHSRAEVDSWRGAFAREGLAPRVVLTHLPFLRRASTAVQPVRRVVFAPQSLVPGGRRERLVLLDGLAWIADAGYEVVVKLRARRGERQTHNEQHPYEDLWDAEHGRLGHPATALRFVDGPMSTWLTPDAALVTVSSTAALESLSFGLPTVIVDDFAVAETLLNVPFVGSGCLASLAGVPTLLAAGGPTPDPEWLERNYLHEAPSELPAAIDELAAERAAGTLPEQVVVPRSWLGYLRTVVRSAVPLELARRLVGRG